MRIWVFSYLALCYNEAVRPTGRGVIECIGAGFGLVHRRPVLVLLPVLVDVFLWLAPRVSPAPFVQTIEAQIAEDSDRLVLEGSTGSVNDQLSSLARDLGDLDLMGILGWQVPSFLHVTNNQSLTDGVLISIGSLWGLLLVVVGIGLISILLACVYLGSIAQWVRTDAWDSGLLQSSLGSHWRRLALYSALLTGASLVAVVLLIMLWAVFQAFNPVIGGLFISVSFGVGLLATLYLFLVKPAIFLGELGVLEAIRESITLVKSQFGSVLGFFVLLNILSLGIGLILTRISVLPAGLIVAVAVNAYLATGLTVAIMLYYWDRSSHTMEENRQAIEEV